MLLQCKSNFDYHIEMVCSNKIKKSLPVGFSFAESAFGDGPEILFLISDLSHNANAVSFISHFGCEEYFRFNKNEPMSCFIFSINSNILLFNKG